MSKDIAGCGMPPARACSRTAASTATVINQQFNTTRRFRSAPYLDDAKVLKDTITAKITGEEALRRILNTK